MYGTSYQLPFLGKMSWENAVAQPNSGETTVVIALDDSTPGQVYVYVGTKRRHGTPVERAGLVGGELYGIEAVGYPTEPDLTGIPSGTPIRLVQIDDQETKTGTEIEGESLREPITEFKRPEDGSWDPQQPDDFYWVTTDRPREQNGRSRLWRLNFGDLSDVESGDVVGTIDMVLDGTEGQEMLDNMTVDRFGRVLMQEDPGNDQDPGKIWSYEIAGDDLVLLAQQKQAHVQPGNTNPSYGSYATPDDETSGIIPAEFLGKGWYLFDSQIHRDVAMANQAKLVEKGQLLALYYPPPEGD
jgi:secreted PhoX family phosphatase